MGWLILLAVVLLAIAAAVARLMPANRPDGFPYVRNATLFSPAERSFLGVLDQAVGEEYRIFGKVRVAEVASVQGTHGRGAWQRAFNRISAKHVDFLLCNRRDLSVVAAIELDDQSHRQRSRRERDAFLAGLCEAIALPLIRIPARRSYSVPELREEILSALGVERQAPTPSAPEADAVEPVEAAGVEAPTCPQCSAPMVRRRIDTEARAGKAFWGCSDSPACRGVLPITL